MRIEGGSRARQGLRNFVDDAARARGLARLCFYRCDPQFCDARHGGHCDLNYCWQDARTWERISSKALTTGKMYAPELNAYCTTVSKKSGVHPYGLGL